MPATGIAFSFSWEIALMEWLQENLNGVAISILSFCSMFGEEILLILILGFLYWCYDKDLGRTTALTVLMGLTWGAMLKNIVLRRRPYFDHDEIRILRVVEPEADIYDISAQGYSFPSIHSANAMGLFGSLALYLKKKWLIVLAFALPLLTGISRVVVGAHHPTDVLAGWIVGGLCILLINILEKKITNRVLLFGCLLLTVLPGFFFCRSADYFSSVGLLIGLMGAALLDEYYVHFEITRKPFWMIMRLLGGFAVYFVLNTLLKLPFSEDFLESGTYSALMVRCARYMIIAFVDFGVYPLLFRKEKRTE